MFKIISGTCHENKIKIKIKIQKKYLHIFFSINYIIGATTLLTA